jgi:arsenite/tail-anchored protein-transporting ATPase
MATSTAADSPPRIILFTGKGGVGKTTAAAATALRCAELGKKTLVISTDPAHSLGDALDRELGAEPQTIAPNLDAQELDIYYSMKKYWGNVRTLLLQVFQWQGVENVVAEELAALPGMEEASAFLWLDNYVLAKTYDVIIIDSAPTGETLTLLTLPQTVQWWMTRAFPFQKAAVQTVGAAVRTFTGIPLDKGFMELDELFTKLQRMQKLMTNPDVASIRIVMNPERMVIQEARRAYTYLQMYGFSVDGVVVNRIMPDVKDGSFFAEYVKAQKKYLVEIEESFAPLPNFRIPHAGKEVFGLDLLRTVAESLYPTDIDPTTFFFKDKPFELVQDGKRYILRTKLPFTDAGEASVKRVSDEIVIQIKNRRKNLFLPRFLTYYTLNSTVFADGWLTLTFSPGA